MLPTVRQAELLVVVVRDFRNDSVPAYRNRIDAQADFDEVWAELMFSDLEAVANRIEKLEKSLKKPTATHELEKHELGLLTRCKEALRRIGRSPPRYTRKTIAKLSLASLS